MIVLVWAVEVCALVKAILLYVVPDYTGARHQRAYTHCNDTQLVGCAS